jgi:excinuclease ABC subunit C
LTDRRIDALEKIKRMTTRPGVYLMKDTKGDIIYIGKAKNLRSRVKSYFGKIEDSRYAIRFLLSQIEDIDCIITDTEKEALILENSLIKKHKPRYNVNLKDDKTYFSLRLSIKDRFPKLSLVRKIKKDGARYFGPYSSGYAVKDTLKTISQIFCIRTCNDSNFNNRIRPCLNHQIKRCLAPCSGMIDEESYQKHVREVILFLVGRNRELLRLLRKRMKEESDDLNFEDAARIRDRIFSIEKTIERQKVVSHAGTDQDVFAFYREAKEIEIQVMIIRKGRVLQTLPFFMSGLNLPDREIVSSFLKQYYSEDRFTHLGIIPAKNSSETEKERNVGFIPSEIIIPFDIEDMKVMEEWLSERRGIRVRIHIPKRGNKLDLLRMVMENAKNSFLKRQSIQEPDLKTLEEIRARLHLKRLPKKIECFDISNISGRLAVGSMVVFQDGRPNKRDYRRYKIRNVDHADDYGMMYEVLKRRQGRVSSIDDLPDLVMVDGGRGQLNIVMKVLKELKRDSIDVISLAKGGEREKVFAPHWDSPVILQKRSKAFLLLQQIRDEAHRFALTYHQNLRKKQNMRSILDEIPGVGNLRKKALLRNFGGLKRIKGASIDELSQIPGMNTRVARDIYEFFQN